MKAEFTERDIDVLRELAQGKTLAETGEALGLTRATVNAHLHRIYLRLGVHRLIDALDIADRRGLL